MLRGLKIHDEAIDTEQDERATIAVKPARYVEELVERVSIEQRGGEKSAEEGADDPMIAVTMNPPGSSPGRIAFAIAPPIKPPMTTQ